MTKFEVFEGEVLECSDDRMLQGAGDASTIFKLLRHNCKNLKLVAFPDPFVPWSNKIYISTTTLNSSAKERYVGKQSYLQEAKYHLPRFAPSVTYEATLQEAEVDNVHHREKTSNEDKPDFAALEIAQISLQEAKYHDPDFARLERLMASIFYLYY